MLDEEDLGLPKTQTESGFGILDLLLAQQNLLFLFLICPHLHNLNEF